MLYGCMNYFLDNTFSPRFVGVLRAMGVDACHLTEHFAPETPDHQWIPFIGEKNWILITGDLKIRTKPVNKMALKRANIPAVFIHSGFTSGNPWKQISWLTAYWPEIARSCHQPGVCYDIGRNGAITVMPNW